VLDDEHRVAAIAQAEAAASSRPCRANAEPIDGSSSTYSVSTSASRASSRADALRFAAGERARARG
jgi:hypothetical protein